MKLKQTSEDFPRPEDPSQFYLLPDSRIGSKTDIPDKRSYRAWENGKARVAWEGGE